MSLSLIRYTDAPRMWDETESISGEVWPEYNLHGDVLGEYWPRLLGEFPEFHFLLYDDEEQVVVAEGHTAPCAWDGTPDGLGSGIDEMIASAFATRASGSRVCALCALAAEIRPRHQGRGLAQMLLAAMAELARERGLAHLVAPVRPSWKERYPITPIERYVQWRRADGQPFDPWIRIHVRAGGQVVKPLPRSLQITGTVAEWERWVGLQFPEDGCYTFPRGLAPVTIERDLGSYWEPNVWIVHTL